MAVQSRHVHPHQLLWSHHKPGAVFPSHPPVRLSPQQIESPLSAVTSHRQPGARTHVGWYCTAYSRMVALHRAHCATAEREAAIDLTKPIGRFIKSAERPLERHYRESWILWGTVRHGTARRRAYSIGACHSRAPASAAAMLCRGNASQRSAAAAMPRRRWSCCSNSCAGAMQCCQVGRSASLRLRCEVIAVSNRVSLGCLSASCAACAAVNSGSSALPHCRPPVCSLTVSRNTHSLSAAVRRYCRPAVLRSTALGVS